MKKILFISYDGMTDPLGQSQVIPYLAGLTKYGYRFTILSCDKPQKYLSQKKYVEQLIAGYSIEWVSIPYHKDPPVLSSVFDYNRLRQKAKQLHKKNNFDMVHTRPGLPVLIALWMKKKYGIKFLNDIRGFWADERVDGGMWNIKNPVFNRLYKFFKKKEEECLLVADYNICLTRKAKQIILNMDHLPKPVKLEVIPCSVDLRLFNKKNIDQKNRDLFRAELRINSNDLIISYLGSIGGWYLTGEMLRFCKKVFEKDNAVKFLFISNNRHQDILKAAAIYNIPSSNILIRSAQRHEIPALLSLSNYSLFFIKPCYSKLSSSPTKHGEIMAMEIPVITNAGVGDVKEIVEQYHAGYVLKDFSEDEIQAVAKKIAVGPGNFNPQEIRQGAEDIYSLEKALRAYAEVYKKIFGEM